MNAGRAGSANHGPGHGQDGRGAAVAALTDRVAAVAGALSGARGDAGAEHAGDGGVGVGQGDGDSGVNQVVIDLADLAGPSRPLQPVFLQIRETPAEAENVLEVTSTSGRKSSGKKFKKTA